MADVVVFTDDGREVGRLHVADVGAGTMTWRRLVGRADVPLGFLGRALDDARIIQQGGDPERTSEKVMRLMDRNRRLKLGGNADLIGGNDD